MTSLLRAIAVCLLLVLTYVQQGATQARCFSNIRCQGLPLLQPGDTCCGVSTAQGHSASGGAEACFPCFTYGWVREIGSEVYIQQETITADEGDTIPLTIFYTKNADLVLDVFLFNIVTAGTARLGDDYELTQNSIFLPTTPAFVNVTLLRDGVAGEPTETIILTLMHNILLPPTDNQILLFSTVIINVQDNDLETGFNVTSLTVREGDLNEELCLITVGSPPSDTIIDVTVIYGTARAEDINLRTLQVVITSSEPNPCVRFDALVDNLALEGTENLTLSLSGPNNVMFGIASVEVMIEDADVVVFEFSGGGSSTRERDGVINVEVTYNVAIAVPVSLIATPVKYSPDLPLPPDLLDAISEYNALNNPNIATPGVDYRNDSVMFTIDNSGSSSRTEVIQFEVFDDMIHEASEQYFIAFLSFSGDSIPAGAEIGRNVTLLIIQDDDNQLLVFEQQNRFLNEDDVNVTYSLNVGKTLETELTYTFRVFSLTGTAETNDFSIPSEVVTFPPEQPTVTFPVTVIGDLRIELTEDFTLRLVRSGGSQFLVDMERSLTTVNIIDNDGDYEFVPAQPSYTVQEGSSVVVCFENQNPTSLGTQDRLEFDFTVTLVTEDGEATGRDYIEVNQSSTFNEGGGDIITVCVIVIARDDTIVEGAESFYVVGQVEGDIPVVFKESAEIIIISDDVAGISWSDTTVTVIENAIVEVCLGRVMEELETTITVEISVVPGTAREGLDFEAEGKFVIFGPEMMLFPGSGSGAAPGSGMESGCVTVAALEDNVYEDPESLSLVVDIVTSGVAEVRGSDTTTVTIMDATEVVVEFTEPLVSVREGRSVTVCVSVTEGTIESEPPAGIELNTVFVTGSGIDESEVMCESQDCQTFSLLLTSTEPEACFQVSVADDRDVESLQSFEISLTTAQPRVAIGNTVTVDVIDDDVTVALSQLEYLTSEAEGSVEVCVAVVAGSLLENLTLTLTTADNTATSGEDYDGGIFSIILESSSSLTFECAVITISPDDLIENAERFSVTVTTSADFATVSEGVADVVIAEERASIGFEQEVYMTSEMRGSVTVCVVVDNGILDFTLEVDVSISGTATEGEDFTVDTPTIAIMPGTNRGCLNITILPSDLVEREETIELSITSTSPEASITRGMATVLISSDGVVTVGFGSATYTFPEGEEVMLVVQKSGPIDSPINFRVFGAMLEFDGTFEAGADSPDTIVILFNTTDNDIALEPHLVFPVSLEIIPPDPQIVVGISETVVTIFDDDVVAVGIERPTYRVTEGDLVFLVVRKSGPIAVPITFRVSGGGLVNDMATFDAGVDVFNVIVIPFNTTDNDIALEPDLVFNVTLEIITPDPRIIVAIRETTVTVGDDDVVSVGFESAAYQFTEGEPGVLVVQKSGPIAVPITFRVSGGGLVDDMATFDTGVDASDTITIPFNTTDNDIALDPDLVIPVSLEIITPHIVSFNPRIIFDIRETTVTIVDDDVVSVGFESASYTFAEGVPQVLVVQKSGPIAIPIDMVVSSSGGESGLGSGGYIIIYTISFEAGLGAPNTIEVVLDASDDEVALEPQELVTVSLIPLDTRVTLDIDETIVTIIDDDEVMVGFGAPNVTVSEDDGTFRMCVVKDRETAVPVAFTVTDVPGTATLLEDYNFTSVSAELGETEAMSCVEGLIIDDDVFLEGTEEFTLELMIDSPSGLAGDTTTIIIEDNDNEVTIGFAEVNRIVEEDAGDIEISVTILVPDLTAAVTVDIGAVSSTAVEGQDFFATDAVLTFDGSQASLTYSVLIDDDDIGFEFDESFTITLSNPQPGSVVLSPDTITITIRDNDEVIVGFGAPNVTFSEDDGTFRMCVVKDRETAVPVAFTVTDFPGTATLDDYSFTPVSAELSETETRSCVDGLIIDDDVFLEGTEEFTLELMIDSPSGLAGDTTTIFIEDNDNEVTIGFFEVDATIDEDAGDIVILVVTSAPDLAVPVTVDIGAVSGTAVVGEDFFAIDSELTFDGSDNGLTYSMLIDDDDIGFEFDESFTITLSNPQPGSVVLSPDTITITIRDNDEIIIQLLKSEYTFIEGQPVTETVVCAEVAPFSPRLPTTPTTVVIPVQTFDVTATAPDDYVQNDATITITDTTTTDCASFEIVNDVIVEGDEMFTVAITEIPGVSISPGPNTTTVVILDNNDDRVTIGFTDTDITVTEGESTSLVIELFDGELGEGVVIELTIGSSGTASEGIDYTLAPDTVALSSAVRTAVIGISTVDDSLLEGGEFFVASLTYGGPLLGVDLSPGQATVTIEDAEVVSITPDPSSITVSENVGRVSLCVRLSLTLASSVVMDISVTGTAIPVADFDPLPSSLVIPDNETESCFDVTIVDDGILEQEERLIITFTPTDTVISPAVTTITITDDDGAVLVNNTVVGDPFYTVPIEIDPVALGLTDELVSLCYEIHGQSNMAFNLVNDACTLVNAHYTKPFPSIDINVVNSVGIRAVDNFDECHDVRMDLAGCSVAVDDTEIGVNGMYSHGGISVRRFLNRVRVSVPNCDKTQIVMWMICESAMLLGAESSTDLIKFVVARGLSLSEFAHGLLGQFWNVPLSVDAFTGNRGFLTSDLQVFYVTIDPPGDALSRTFVSVLQMRVWDRTRKPCLYSGNRQGGPIGDVPVDESPNGSVIEGDYKDYIVTSIFANDCIFCNQFDEDRCMASGENMIS